MDDKPFVPYQVPYMGFTRDTDEDDASARFVAKHGVPPERIIDDEKHNVMLLGPEPGARE